MYQFDFHIPTHLIFGNGAIARIPEVTCELPGPVLLVTGKAHARSSNLIDRVTGSLRQAGKQVTLCMGAPSNPTIEFVMRGAELARSAGCRLIVGMGGGSALDAARVIAIAVTHPGDVWDYRVMGELSVDGITDKVLPLVTVATTAGSGTELSPAALITRGHSKEVFYSPFLFPKTAITDPSLMTSLPLDLSREMAMDAFVQGLEAFLSKNAQPFSNVYALAAMKAALNGLRALNYQSVPLEVRAEVALAGILSLFAINQAGVGAIHALSNPLSGRFGLHHGRALGVLLTAVMEANCDSVLDRLPAVAALFGIDTTKPKSQIASETLSCMAALVKNPAFKCDAREIGATRADLDEMVVEAHNPDLATNLSELDDGKIRSIYLKALWGESHAATSTV